MMKRRLSLTLSLAAVLLISACTPGATPLVDAPSPTLGVAVQPPVELTATLPVEAPPIATSRGPDLHATDPTTVNLAAGQLHFVEFFRFT